jgi:L-ascorbate metabolism protein UlaG (beta-lactamase superfamily)
MRISKYVHACLLLEDGKDKILFDLGKFSFVEGLVKPGDFRDLTAIIITHRHPDHIDDDALKQIVGNNEAAVVLANSEIKSQLAEKGVGAEVFETGRRAVGAFNVEALAAVHAKILNAGTPQNVAYVVNNLFLHPGDSFDPRLDAYKGTQVLALPIMAPWNTELEVAEFARRMSPREIIPIHDGYAKDFFLKQRYENFQKYFSSLGIGFQWMDKPGDYFEV